ncbi:response regulator transcription factor [Paenibacillus thalictri]|uniref:Helix-turn-helix domain-containing protein n=1 Tax=Paenibacillus thalictri TaxID=2527873 RepID=A0A4Q9DQB0_9BACL|nr:helix-turn-helix domain-containing protein [Paenibacillus thalictri]TBL76583.1 helix-turn-helix domain-containing protein [Paenibacillus thalictri]
MWKVLLVDDSYPVLEFLSQVVPWESLGMQVAGQHLNGLTALEHCKLDMPHLLITDIGMPEMNGLDLIKAVKEINPRMKVIILSCHDEFPYAQQAVKLSVNDYVLKETMEPETMIQLLENMRLQLEQENKERSGHEQLKSMMDRHRSSLKTNFMRATLANPLSDPKRWLAEAQGFGVDLDKYSYLPVLCYANQFSKLKQRFQEVDLLTYAIENGVNELIDAKVRGVNFQCAGNEMILMIPLQAYLESKAFDLFVPHLRAMQEEFESYLRISLSFMISKPALSPQEIKRNVKELMESKDLRFYATSRSIYKWSAFQSSNDDIYKYYSNALDEFKQLIAEGETDRVQGELDRWENWIRSNHFKAEEVRGWVIKLLSDIDLKYRSQQHFHNVYSTELFHNTLLEFESLEELFVYMQHYFMEKIDYVAKTQRESQRKEVIEAKRYVMTHLSKKISMDEVARMLHLNGSHFSRIFKMETGETFIEFVTRVKMEQAQEYLLQSEKTVEQIAEMVGYENTSYFIKLFKSLFGMSPLDYRRLK